MVQTPNLCAQIPAALHTQVCEAREAAGLTTAQYVTELLTEYFKMKESGGNITMTNNNTRTLAFQISEDLFQRIKAHLERETQRTGRKLTQREFVLGLIEEALEAAKQQAEADKPEAGGTAPGGNWCRPLWGRDRGGQPPAPGEGYPCRVGRGGDRVEPPAQQQPNSR